MRVPRGPSNVPQSLRSGVRAIEITLQASRQFQYPITIVRCGMCLLQLVLKPLSETRAHSNHQQMHCLRGSAL